MAQNVTTACQHCICLTCKDNGRGAWGCHPCITCRASRNGSDSGRRSCSEYNSSPSRGITRGR